MGDLYYTLYYIILHHVTLYHAILYHTKPYQAILYHTMSPCTIPYYTDPQTLPFGILPEVCQTASSWRPGSRPLLPWACASGPRALTLLLSQSLGIQIAQSRSYSYTLGTKVRRYYLCTWSPREWVYVAMRYLPGPSSNSYVLTFGPCMYYMGTWTHWTSFYIFRTSWQNHGQTQHTKTIIEILFTNKSLARRCLPFCLLAPSKDNPRWRTVCAQAAWQEPATSARFMTA